MASALTADGGERDSDLVGVTNYLSTRRPGKGGTRSHRRRLLRKISTAAAQTKSRGRGAAMNAMACTLRSRPSPGRLAERECRPSNPAREVLLHSVGHLDQPPPRMLEE